MVPAWPSSSTIMPGGIAASAPTAPITAGMPSECARMAACAVRVPSSLMSPTTCSRSSCTVSPGESSWATTMTCSSAGIDQSSWPDAAHEPVEHPELDGVQVGQALAQPGGAGPEVPELERLELVGGLGAELVVADQGLDRGQEVLVLRHEDLGVEDARLLGAGALQHPLAQIPQVAHDVVHRLAEPAHLRPRRARA